MEAQVRLVIYVNGNVYDDLIITENIVEDYAKNSQRLDRTEKKYLRLNRRGVNSYLTSAYVSTIKRSSLYRRSALKMLLKFSLYTLLKANDAVICMRLTFPRFQYLDYKWNERITQMALERRELDHAMSWLSTLGGGFSALGETFEHCAEMAGKISVRQLQLALRLEDPLLVARCKLWAALSLLQRGYLKVSKRIVEDNYRLAVAEKDVRLQNMCKGVWAKLQYTYKVKKQLKKSQSTFSY